MAKIELATLSKANLTLSELLTWAGERDPPLDPKRSEPIHLQTFTKTKVEAAEMGEAQRGQEQ